MIFFIIAKCMAVLTGLLKKGLDPLIKYYNNQTIKQKTR